MKAFVAALVATFVLAGLAGSADAKQTKRYVKKHYVHKKYAQYGPRTYWVRDANRLPYGTGIWWEQMDREGRGGRH